MASMASPEIGTLVGFFFTRDFTVARFDLGALALTWGLSRDSRGLQPIMNYRIKSLRINTNYFI
jgi:hypothetical protein